MRYRQTPTAENAKRSLLRFAIKPRRIGWVWVWLEPYVEVQSYIDPDNDGRYAWTHDHDRLASPRTVWATLPLYAALLFVAVAPFAAWALVG